MDRFFQCLVSRAGSNGRCNTIWCGVLVLDVLQALQDQVQIGRVDFSGGRSYL